MKKNKIYQDLVGMAWSDKISFEEIEKKNRDFRKRRNQLYEKNS